MRKEKFPTAAKVFLSQFIIGSRLFRCKIPGPKSIPAYFPLFSYLLLSCLFKREIPHFTTTFWLMIRKLHSCMWGIHLHCCHSVERESFQFHLLSLHLHATSARADLSVSSFMLIAFTLQRQQPLWLVRIHKSCMRWQKGSRKKEASKFASFYDDVYTTHEQANLRKETQHHEKATSSRLTHESKVA